MNSTKSLLPNRIFVTGTDTMVGKTVVSALLTIGLKGHYWKPVQSGTDDGTDSAWIESVSKPASVVNLIDSTCGSGKTCLPETYKLRAPLSPHASASLDGIRIDLAEIRLPEISPLIVEGAGGIMVPLNEKECMVNLIQKFSLPTLVVARSGLGTINHTLLTIAKLRDAGVDILGVVMNGPKNSSNKHAIEHYGQVKVLAEIPNQDNLNFECLLDLFTQNFTVEPTTCEHTGPQVQASIWDSAGSPSRSRRDAGAPSAGVRPASLDNLSEDEQFAFGIAASGGVKV